MRKLPRENSLDPITAGGFRIPSIFPLFFLDFSIFQTRPEYKNTAGISRGGFSGNRAGCVLVPVLLFPACSRRERVIFLSLSRDNWHFGFSIISVISSHVSTFFLFLDPRRSMGHVDDRSTNSLCNCTIRVLSTCCFAILLHPRDIKKMGRKLFLRREMRTSLYILCTILIKRVPRANDQPILPQFLQILQLQLTLLPRTPSSSLRIA